MNPRLAPIKFFFARVNPGSNAPLNHLFKLRVSDQEDRLRWKFRPGFQVFLFPSALRFLFGSFLGKGIHLTSKI
jgi:hypothetical protein